MTLDRTRHALLVIDAMDPKGEGREGGDAVYDPGSPMARYRSNVAAAVDVCHGAGVPVIYCCDQHIPGLDRELALWGDHGIRGQMELFPEIDRHPDDLVVPKRRYSGFFQTDLDLTLRELGVTCVVAVGADTNICVLHTLADAYFLGYDSVVVEDATTTYLCGTQEGALEHCAKCYGSRIVSVADLPALLG